MTQQTSSRALDRSWNGLLTALEFLTRLPLPRVAYYPDSLANAVVWFPFVGLLIGAGAVGVHALAAKGLPSLLAALVTLIYLVAITGALHEDGLADTADGLGGGWTRERSLEDHARQPHRKLWSRGGNPLLAGTALAPLESAAGELRPLCPGRERLVPLVHASAELLP